MRRVFTAQQLQRMKDAYVIEEKSLEKLAIDFGISVPTVTKYLRKQGVQIRSVGRRRKHPVPVAVVVETVEEPVVAADRETPLFEW